MCTSNEGLALKILVGTFPFLQLSTTTSLVLCLTRLWEKSQFLSPEPTLFRSSDQSCPHLFYFLCWCDSQQKPALAPAFISSCRAAALLAGNPSILRWSTAPCLTTLQSACPKPSGFLLCLLLWRCCWLQDTGQSFMKWVIVTGNFPSCPYSCHAKPSCQLCWALLFCPCYGFLPEGKNCKYQQCILHLRCQLMSHERVLP